LLLDLRHRLRDRGANADVARETLHVEAAAAEALHCGLQTPFAHIPRADPATFGCQSLDDGQADSARSPGHDTDDAFEAPRLRAVHETAKAFALAGGTNHPLAAALPDLELSALSFSANVAHMDGSLLYDLIMRQRRRKGQPARPLGARVTPRCFP